MSAGRTNSHQKSVHWNTPPKYADLVHRFFRGKLELDPCSNAYSLIRAKRRFLLPKEDGLKLSWRKYGTVFVNPPYGRDRDRGTSIKDWIAKCCRHYSKNEAQVLALIPVATNTSHWKEYIFGKATCICFLSDTRLKFVLNGVEDKKGAPMACAMVYWGEQVARFSSVFKDSGYVVCL